MYISHVLGTNYFSSAEHEYWHEVLAEVEARVITRQYSERETEVDGFHGVIYTRADFFQKVQDM